MKPKKGLISSMQNTSIKIPDKFKSKNVQIQNSIEKLRTDCHIEEQQRLIKVLPEYLASTEDSEFVTSLLTYLFITIDSKHPIRKTISRILLTASTDLIKKTLSGNILYLINMVKDEDDYFYSKRFEVILNLQNCFNNFPPGVESISYITEEVTSFAVDFFINLVDILCLDESEQMKKSDVHSYIYNVTKLLVSILQQCILSDTLPEYSSKLMLAAYKVITKEYISFDTKSNCGLLMVVSAIHIPDHIANDFRFKTNPCLCLLKFDKVEDDNQGFFNFKDLAKNYTANLCVYSGILNVVPQNILCEEVIDGVPVISFMFSKLLECAKKCTGKPTQILEVSRALILISKIMNTIPLSYVEPMFVQGLEYVWTHLDHFVDTVKHSARTIFENLIKLAYRHYRDGFTTLLNLILTNMIDLLVFRCTHYVALTILSNETGCAFLLEQFCHLPFILLINIVDSSVSPQICNTYELLMSQHAREEPCVQKWLELWVDLVKPLLTRSVPPVTQYYQRLLMSACKIRPLVLKSIMHYKWYTGANELGALIGCLRIARKSGFQVPLEQEDLSDAEKRKKYWRNYIEYDFLDLMMCHQTDEVRIAILALIVESQKSTEIFSTWELSYLKKYFYYNVTTQSPNTRQQIIAYFKKALTRIKEGLAVLTRHSTTLCNRIKAGGSDASKKGLLEELQMYKKQEVNYKVFMENLFEEYLCAGIQEGANFPRRATCLDLILFMLTENCIEIEELEKNWKPTDTMSILNILIDSYESNISTAFQIIKILPISLFVQFNSKELMRHNLNHTISLASAIKPTTVTSSGYKLQVHLMSPHAHELILEALDHSVDFDDTFVLTITLFIRNIEKGLDSTDNIIAAVKKAPVYGHILCIRHLIEKEDFSQCKYWEYLLTKLVALCKRVNDVVSPIVNKSSPEGYVPLHEEPLNHNGSHVAISSQVIVVYAWRTVKEVSLLLGVLALKAPAVDPRTGRQLLTNEIMHSIEQHFFNLFLETKHRGVYEQAYLGFCKFCEKLWRSPNAEYRTWPKLWLVDILNILKGDSATYSHNLCPTRRSAGLPFMIQAIVITEPRDMGNENFHMCMKSLLKIAAETSEEHTKSRIHAMNVLRSLYRNNHLGELVTPYIAQGVITAHAGFHHDTWGIRNSATLLFSTLIIRMFGVQRTRNMEELSLKNRMSARVFFMRYSELYDYLLQQLIMATDREQNNIALQPILLILERLYACNTEEEIQLGKYLPYVTKCLSSPVYKIRELAAQTSTSLIPNLEAVGYIQLILNKLTDVTLTNNCCQGLILQLMDVLRSLNKGYTPLNAPDMIEATFWIVISVGKYISHYTAALYFDMIVSLTTIFRKNCQGALVFAKLVEIILWQSVKDSGTAKVLSTAKKKYNLSRLNLQVHIMSNLYNCDSYFKSLYIKEEILSGLSSVHDEINQYCLNYINYLNFDHPKYTKHSLYLTEQLETSETELKLVNALDTSVREYVIENIHKDLERKLLPVFYDLLDKNKECCLCVLLAIQHYPCFLYKIKPSIQEVLDFLMNWCRCDDDEMYCASLSVISTFLNSLSDDDLKQLNFNVLFKVVVDGSSPTSTAHQRISVAHFLVANKRLFCEKNFFISADDVSDLWHVVIILLEDDDPRVRDAISQLCVSKDPKQASARADGEFPVLAEKAREDLLNHCVEVLPFKITTALLLSWALRRTPEEEKQFGELFERGEMNAFAEEEQLAKLAVYHLKEQLWKLEDGLNYEDRSIFVEEHTYIVATTIYNTLYRNLPTAVNTSIRISLLCILKKLLDFLEKCSVNKHDFHMDLGRLVLQEFLSMSMQKTNANTNRIKYILKTIFDIEHGWPH